MSKKCNVRDDCYCIRYLIIDSEKWHKHLKGTLSMMTAL